MFYAIVVIIVGFFFGLQHDTEMHPFWPKNPVLKEYKNEYEAQKKDLKEEYEKAKLPKSGYMLVEEYEKESKGIDNETRIVEDRKYPVPKDMKYVPQPTYKLVRYNNPPGTVELNIPRRIEFERQVNAQGVVTGDFTKLVYSSVYYYPQERCYACDVFVIPLDTKLSRVERVQKANVIKKIPKPIFSTSKDTSTEGAFRTITVVDFSEDNTYVVAKEKTGYIFDGIWKTDLLLHDFKTGETRKLTEAREAILDYWHNVSGVEFDDFRWDIYPLGFSKQNPHQILVSGYAYTGGVPYFIGTWGVDIIDNRTELIGLDNNNYPVSIVGYKLVSDGYVSRDEVEWEAKRQKKLAKRDKRLAKKELRQRKKELRKRYRQKRKELRMKYNLRVKTYKKGRKSGMSGLETNFDSNSTEETNKN